MEWKLIPLFGWSLNFNEMISTLNANDMDCTCQHQGCIISDQQYFRGSVIHPIKVTQGIIIVNLRI